MWRRRSPSGHHHDGLRGIGRALGETVLGTVGLKIDKIWTDVPEAESIIELVLI